MSLNVITTAFFNDILQDILAVGTANKLYIALLTNNAATYIGTNTNSIANFDELEEWEVGEEATPPTGYPDPPVGYENDKYIENVTVVDNILDGNDVVWDNGGSNDCVITARFAVVYDYNTGISSSQRVIAIFDFGGDKICDSGTFTVSWHATNGILKLSQL